MLCPKVTELHTQSHINIEAQREQMPSDAWTEGQNHEKPHLRMTATHCHPKPQGGKMLLQATAVNYNTPKNFLRPLQARSHAVWVSHRGYIFTSSCCFMT